MEASSNNLDTANRAGNVSDPELSLQPDLVLLGQYRLVRAVGHGPMGEVWQARDMVGDRFVALKFVPKDVAGSEIRLKRIQENFHAVYGLNHQHICPVYAIEHDTEHGYFHVMKWLEGRSLSIIHQLNARAEGRLPIQLVPQLLESVATALDHAHRHGVVHGEVKPTNIFVFVKNNKILDVSVIDFGLETEVREMIAESKETGNIVDDTLYYTAPEQWQGAEANPKTDQYSLAVIAYQLYAGVLPFKGDDFATLRRSVISFEPQLVAHLPATINIALAKALSKSPQSRFGNCTEFIRAIKIQPKSAVSSSSSNSERQLATGHSSKEFGGSGSNVFGEASVPSHGSIRKRRGKDSAINDTFSFPRFIQAVFTDSPKGIFRRETLWAGRLTFVSIILLTMVLWLKLHDHVNIPGIDTASVSDEPVVAVNGADTSAPTPPPPVSGLQWEQGQFAGERRLYQFGDVEYPFRWIAPGSFVMGSPAEEEGHRNDEPEHEVTISTGFWLLETEVTQEMYRDVMGKSSPGAKTSIDNFPANSVSYREVVLFCRKLNEKTRFLNALIAVPSENQWEYAARAGTKTPFAGIDDLDPIGWYQGNSNGRKQAVRLKSPNPWGLYDMHGSLTEWCNDWYLPYAQSSAPGPLSLDGAEVVLRGGSYLASAIDCRSAARDKDFPATYRNEVGFRLMIVPMELDNESLFLSPLYVIGTDAVESDTDPDIETESPFGSADDSSFAETKIVNPAQLIPEDDKPLSLDWSGNDTTDSQLKTLVGMTQLRSLSLRGNRMITDEGLANLSNLTDLQMLNLTDCRRISDRGLAKLSPLENIRVLELTDCKELTDSGLIVLQNFRRLQWLMLSNTGVTATGMNYLTKIPSLQLLHLENCPGIDDAALIQIASIGSLTELDLTDCSKITDTGVEKLALLKNLQTLKISGCPDVTGVAVTGLQLALPNCRVER